MRLADIRGRLKFRRSDRSPTSAELNAVINDVYRDICSRRRWSWLRRTHRFQTRGTASGAAVTFVTGKQGSRKVIVGTVPTNMVAFGKLVTLDGWPYRFDGQHNATTWLLDTPFLSADGDYAPVYYFDEVSVPRDCAEIIRFRLFTSASDPEWLQPVGSDLAHLNPTETGEPRFGAATRRDALPRPERALSALTNVGSGAGPLTDTGVASAVFKYAYAHYDIHTGAESPIGPSVSVTINTAFSWTLTVTSGTHVRENFGLRIYRTKAGGSTFYFHSDLRPTATFVDTIRDENLGESANESGSSMYLRLWPVPDAVYIGEVEYGRLIQPMAADDDQPVFADSYHHLILAGAEAILLDRASEQGRAESARRRFEEGIVRMVRQDGTISTRRVRKSGNKLRSFPRGVAQIPRWVR